LERLFLLVYPMVDFVALKRTALTTPFFETICLHFVSCFVYIFSDIHLFTFFSCFVYISGPLFLMMDMIQGGNRMVFVFRRHSENFFLVFWFSFENFQFFCRKGNFWCFNRWNNFTLWKGGKGEKCLVWRFFRIT